MYQLREAWQAWQDEHMKKPREVTVWKDLHRWAGTSRHGTGVDGEKERDRTGSRGLLKMPSFSHLPSLGSSSAGFSTWTASFWHAHWWGVRERRTLASPGSHSATPGPRCDGSLCQESHLPSWDPLCTPKPNKHLQEWKVNRKHEPDGGKCAHFCSYTKFRKGFTS